MMKTGDLKAVVISVINAEVGLSVKDIKRKVNKISKKEYAYTTIATVLSRLESEQIAVLHKAKVDGRTVNLYYLSEAAVNTEVKGLLQNLLLKFGFGGVRHLGEMLDKELKEEDLDILRQKLEN